MGLLPFLQQVHQLLQTCHLMSGLSCCWHLPKEQLSLSDYHLLLCYRFFWHGPMIGPLKRCRHGCLKSRSIGCDANCKHYIFALGLTAGSQRYLKVCLWTGLVSGGAAEAGVGLLQGRHSEASARDDAFPADALEVQGDDVCQRLLQHLLRQSWISAGNEEASDKLQSLYSQICHLFIRRGYK